MTSGQWAGRVLEGLPDIVGPLGEITLEP